MKTILATAALAVAIASPAFGQSYDPDLGSGNVAPYNYGQTNPTQGRTVRRVAPSAYARMPYDAYARTPSIRDGKRSPYAQYDTEGNLIDENMPGRW
jgi:hypothetical protein